VSAKSQATVAAAKKARACWVWRRSERDRVLDVSKRADAKGPPMSPASAMDPMPKMREGLGNGCAGLDVVEGCM
jgi:hypothetical protein